MLIFSFYFRLAKKEKEAAALEKQVKTTDILNQDLQRRLNQLSAENRKLENQLRVCFLLFSIVIKVLIKVAMTLVLQFQKYAYQKRSSLFYYALSKF